MEKPVASRQSPDAAEETGGEGRDAAPSAEEEAITSDLDALVEDLKRERDEYLELAQRARADFENYRRRSARDAAEAERRGKAHLARGLAPAVDNLERALRAAGVEVETQDRRPQTAEGEPESREVSAHEALAAGVALVHSEIVGALRGAGVEGFEPTGEKFDPGYHEALSSRPAEDGEETGVVVETLQRGYRIGDTLIRPARVVVTS